MHGARNVPLRPGLPATRVDNDQIGVPRGQRRVHVADIGLEPEAGGEMLDRGFAHAVQHDPSTVPPVSGENAVVR